jgi:hypothetical protein
MFPPQNPFRPQATMVIEGASSADLDQPTLIRPSIERLQKLVERYRAGYREAGGGSGRCVAVHGEHGSGKTHALAHAMTYLASQRDDTAPVRIIYVRADGRDVLSFYRKVMDQVSLQELRSLCAEAQASYARDEFTHSRQVTSAESVQAIGNVDSDLDWVAKAFDAHELQPTAVLNRQSEDLDRAGLGHQDFERAIPSMLNPDLVDAAYRWMTGHALREIELRRLGVAENIQDALKVRMGIQALLIMSQRVGRPFALLIDQAETFVTFEDGSLDQENVGILRAIVESVPASSGLLVMAIRESAWIKLPPDLVQRFGPSEIYTAGLTMREATDLVKIYVSPWVENEVSTFPILPAGLREALRNSGGNVREFLQLCSLLFTVAAPDKHPIDGRFARKVLSQDVSPVPDKGRLRSDLTELLTAAHVFFEPNYVIDKTTGATVDFAVTDASGAVRAFIVVTDALFGPQEVTVAKTTLELVRKAQSESRPAEVVLIVGGYMSAELASELGEVHRVIIATAETGYQKMSTLVDDLSKRTSAAGPDTSAVEERLAVMQASLAALEEERDRESKELRERVVALADAQATARRSEEVEETRQQWRGEQENIGRDLRAAREKRQEAELAELERLRGRAEDGRRRSLAIVSVVVTALLVGIGAIWGEITYTGWNLGALLGLAAGTLVVAAGLAVAFGPAAVNELAGPVVSIPELDRLANAYIDRRLPVYELMFPPFFPHARFRRLLWNRNPQFRYAATLIPKNFKLEELNEAVAAERSAIVRRAMVRSIARTYGLRGVEEVFARESGDPATSVAFEVLGEHCDPDMPSVRKLSPEIKTVACLYGFPFGATFLDNFIRATRQEPQEHLAADADLKELAKAYLRDDDTALLRAISCFSERDFRTAATWLSPFDAGRLGTYDWLAKIEDIDQMFLFFRKSLFYLGRGLENHPTQKS